MRQIPGVDHEALERLYLAASAKAQIVGAEHLLREAVENLQIIDAHEAGEAWKNAVRAIVALREKVFQIMETLP